MIRLLEGRPEKISARSPPPPRFFRIRKGPAFLVLKKDQDLERTGPQRIHRDPTLAVMRTKVHFTLFLAGAFAAIGLVCLLKTLLDPEPEEQVMLYHAALTCLLAATICGSAAASFAASLAGAVLTSKQIAETEKVGHDIRSLKRHIESLEGCIGRLDNRFKLAEMKLIDRSMAAEVRIHERLAKLERREGLVLDGVTKLWDKAGDEVAKRRTVARQQDPNNSMS
jgi:hypothetical protein